MPGKRECNAVAPDARLEEIGDRLEGARAIALNSHGTTRLCDAPPLPQAGEHVRQEEDRRGTEHHLEGVIGETESFRILDPQLHRGQPLSGGLAPRLSEHLLSDVHSDYPAPGTGELGCRESRSACPGANIQNLLSRLDVDEFD